MSPWPSGKAGVCKTSDAGSNPVGDSKLEISSVGRAFVLHTKGHRFKPGISNNYAELV